MAAEALDAAKVNQPLLAGRDTGRIIPAALKARQTVCPGTSGDWLRPAQQAASGAGKFIHDSDHWFENMLWEFETAEPAPRRPAACPRLISDAAFDDPCRKSGFPAERLVNVGIIRRTRAV